MRRIPLPSSRGSKAALGSAALHDLADRRWAFAYAWVSCFAGLLSLAAAEDRAFDPNSAFQIAVEPGRGQITSLRQRGDTNGVEFIRAGQSLGGVQVRARRSGGPWPEPGHRPEGLRVQSTFHPDATKLIWRLELTNSENVSVEIGDLAMPLPMNTEYVWNQEETFKRRVFKHAFIAGHGSFLYWLPVGGTGPFLVMQPAPGVSLEYFTATDMDYAFGRERYSVFVHSKAMGETDRRGTWRQPRTSRILAPGATATYEFVFHWADSYEGVREVLYRSGGFDVYVAPGMVIPRDLTSRIALRTSQHIEAIDSEFPTRTKVKKLARRGKDTHLFEVQFTKLGENLLWVRSRGNRAMPLEFFVTEPIETLVRKRASFIVRNQQHRDPTKWYDGLFSLWDRRQAPNPNLLGPDHLGGQHPYAVSGSDDPSNGKSLLVAEKNVAFPDAAEVGALEYFVHHFVWGKHQRTDRETPYPYGIYGADSWQQNRFADRDPLENGVSRPGGPSACRMWRTFDYTTYFALYFDLYRIAKQRPDLVKELDANGYLERAYGTARAYFEVPANIRMEGGWSFTGWVYWQYTVGNFHEKYLLPLIAALEAEGQQAKADWLRNEWEKKVKYFLYDNPWSFASEMPIDSTAYESTYAAAAYALQHRLSADTNLWYDRNLQKHFSHPVIDSRLHQEFLQRQHRANLACRGVLEPNYWTLGSDFRGCGSASYTLSYMSQMGGWAVLDYALRYDPAPAANLRLGYASLLSSWALMNSGDGDSNYGFWSPGLDHDGAMSWGFQPRQIGTEWNPATRDLPRGAWPVCGEADHGLVGAIETARTVLFDDPIFGLIAYGGKAAARGPRLSVIPHDGVRQRLSAMVEGRSLHLALDRDGFAQGKAIELDRRLQGFRFLLESRAVDSHRTQLAVEGLPSGKYTMRVNGLPQLKTVASDGEALALSISVESGCPATRVAVVADGPR